MITDDDLTFALKPETDVKGIQDYLTKVESLAEKTGSVAAKALEKGLTPDTTKMTAALEKGKIDIKAILESFKEGGIQGGIGNIISSIFGQGGSNIPNIIASVLTRNAGTPNAVGVTNVATQPAQPQAQNRGVKSGLLELGSNAAATGTESGLASSAGSVAAAGEAASGIAAVAGPIGLAILAAQAIAKVGGQLAQFPFAVVSGGLSLVSGALHDLQGPLGPIGAGLNVVSKGFDTLATGVEKIPLLGDLLGPMIRQLGAIPGVIKDTLETLTAFASKTGTGRVQQLQMAIDDVQAVIGHAFLPVIDIMKNAVRTLGDVLASILPNSSEAEAALSGFKEGLREIFDEIRNIAREIGPSIRSGLVTALQVLGEVVRAVSHYITIAARTIREALETLGLANPNAQQRSSVGAAARTAQFDSAESYQQRLQQAAFSAGGGGPTQADVPQLMRDSLDRLTQIRDLCQDIVNLDFSRLAERIPGAPAALGVGQGAGGNMAAAAANGAFALVRNLLGR